MAAGALVLLVASINVVGLTIARVLTRRRELAIRRALGGGAWRIARAVLAENLVLGALAGSLGLGIAAALLPVLRVMLPANFPRLQEIVFRWPDAAFALAAGLGASALSGLVAVLRETGADPRQGLNDDARTASASVQAGRLRGALVAAEMALACMLCFAAGLLLRSSQALNERPPGFRPEGVLTGELAFPFKAYSKERLSAFYAEAVRQLREIPGVRIAGFSTSLPWTGYDENSSFDIEGYVPQPGESLLARYQAADPGFFDALGTRLVKGRLISAADDVQSPKVIVINETLARRYFPRGDAVDRVLNTFGAKRRIIGIVEDVRDRPADVAAEPAFWMPLAQEPFWRVRVAIRTEGDPLSLAPAVRAAFQSLDRELPMAEVRSMDDIAATALAQRRFTLWLCESFAILAMALAGIGVYAMLTYTVEQRQREIGIRMALGATRGNVLRLVFRNGLGLAAIGVAVAFVLAPAVGGSLSSLLYGVSSRDSTTLILAMAAILTIAAIGCFAPAWIAVRNEPMITLREQ